MRVRRRVSGLSLLSISMLAVAATAWGAGAEQVLINAQNMNWGAAPAGFPAGAKVAVLYGDPSMAGPYVLRVKLPSKYKVPFHWYSKGQTMTVISGALYVANEQTYSKKIAHAIRPGGFLYLPEKVQQFSFTKRPTEIEISGEGPFDVQYVNPSDDPRHGAKGEPYYFPKQFEKNEMNAPEAGEPIPTF